jgi:hypothetical protein
MSDQTLALLLTLALFAVMAAWVPFLDFLQRVARRRRTAEKTPAGSNFEALSASAAVDEANLGNWK